MPDGSEFRGQVRLAARTTVRGMRAHRPVFAAGSGAGESDLSCAGRLRSRTTHSLDRLPRAAPSPRRGVSRQVSSEPPCRKATQALASSDFRPVGAGSARPCEFVIISSHPLRHLVRSGATCIQYNATKTYEINLPRLASRPVHDRSIRRATAPRPSRRSGITDLCVRR